MFRRIRISRKRVNDAMHGEGVYLTQLSPMANTKKHLAKNNWDGYGGKHWRIALENNVRIRKSLNVLFHKRSYILDLLHFGTKHLEGRFFNEQLYIFSQKLDYVVVVDIPEDDWRLQKVRKANRNIYR